MAGKNTAVFGIYPNRATLESGIMALQDANFRNEDISVLFPENVGTKDFAHEKGTKAPEGAATGAGTGAVVGGVLGENDATTQNRTPGVANIPILGNLFKRKLVTRQSNEILFFITPHIYRPDYQGHPTTSVVGTGNRTTTIPQPVPLGNPESNTPTQQQQQQLQQQQTPAPNVVPMTRPNGTRP